MAVKWLTEAEARARFGDARVTRFADRDGDGAADTGVVVGAIEIAEAMVEAKLLTRYAPGDLPTTPGVASLLLKNIVGGLFIRCLTENCEIVGDEVFKAEAAARKALDDVTRGTSSLLLAGNPDVDNTTPDMGIVAPAAADLDLTGCCTGTSRGTFTQESMRDW